MLKKILPITAFEKTNLNVLFDKKNNTVIFENLDLYTKELQELRKTYRNKIVEDNVIIVTNMVSHYYYHDEKYLFDNIGRAPRIIDAAINVSGLLYKDRRVFTTKETLRYKKCMDDLIEAYQYLVSTVVKIHNELNMCFDIINNEEETYTREQMVNYTITLNKLIDAGKISDVNTISILRQFNDIRNMILHEDARLFSITFKIDEIRAIINCIRICKVIFKRLVMEFQPYIMKAVDLNMLVNNQRLLLKGNF